MKRLLILALVSAALLTTYDAFASNGFDLSNSSIPAQEIHSGGPPRDGIPSIDRPQFVAASEANFIGDKDRVIGVFHSGVAKAYPIKILDWHEIVNDHIASLPVVVTYCPLCGTGIVFRGDDYGRFGVSGLLYNSDVLLYDRETESLWSQIMAEAISGSQLGARLTPLPASHTTWRDWLSRYPDTLVLSTDTGFRRDYKSSPYLDYAKSSQLMFDVEFRNSTFRNKELVLGVSVEGTHKAYPFKALKNHGQKNFIDQIGTRQVTISWSESEETATVFNQNGEEIPSLIAYWFAWYAFHPDTDIFDPGKQ
jgi:hypothetical protein